MMGSNESFEYDLLTKSVSVFHERPRSLRCVDQSILTSWEAQIFHKLYVPEP